VKESDYSTACNLTRLRIALDCLRACVITERTFTPEEVAEFGEIKDKLYNVFTEKLEAIIDGKVK